MALTLAAITVVAFFLASASVLLATKPDLSGFGSEAESDGGKKILNVSIPRFQFYAPIWQRNAFKAAMPKPKAKAKPQAKSIDQLKVAQIGVQLLGTMYSDIDVFSRAVVLVGNKQALNKKGDKLKGFTIAEIQRRAIVLQRGNQRQILFVDNGDRKIAAKSARSSASFSRKELKAKFQNLDALSRDIQVAPASRGKYQGLMVQKLRAGSLFSQAGLQQGDMILNVGGRSVARNVNPMALFKVLDQQSVAIELLRNGKPMTLQVVLNG